MVTTKMENPVSTEKSPRPSPRPGPPKLLKKKTVGFVDSDIVINISPEDILPKKADVEVVTETKLKPKPGILARTSIEQSEKDVEDKMQVLGSKLDFFFASNTLQNPISTYMTLAPFHPKLGETSFLETPERLQVIICKSIGYFNWLWLFCNGTQNKEQVTIKVPSSTEDSINFTYLPRKLFPALNKGREIHIYVPGLMNELGWIDVAKEFSHGTKIFCNLTSKSFMMRKIHEKNSPHSFLIENASGANVASGRIAVVKSLKGRMLQQWTGFQFHLVSSKADTLPNAVRIVLMVAFMSWAIDCGERRRRLRSCVYMTLLFNFLLVCCLLYYFFVGARSQLK